MSTTTHEDFTFPTFTDTLSRTIDSPPLWRLSPAASSDNCQEDCWDGSKPSKCRERKSFSCVEGIKGGTLVEDSEDEREEKMDMLWEDFNEELLTTTSHHSSRFDSERVNVGCVQALRLSKTHKPGFLALVKVLKKLFLLHSSNRSVKNHTSRRPVKRPAWSS